jgi:hypothetical protein
LPSKFRSRLTFANVVSVIALFVALGGSSYAAIKITGKNVKDSSLTGKDVKNSSLTTSDVKNRSLLAKDFKTGQLPKGEKGEKGDAGPPGPTEGKSSDNETHVADVLADKSSITTNRAGHLLVSKSVMSIRAICSGGGTEVSFFLTLDGVRVPGTLVSPVAPNVEQRNVSLTGVTADVIPAGSHEGAIGIVCGPTGSPSVFIDANRNLTLVVLG